MIGMNLRKVAFKSLKFQRIKKGQKKGERIFYIYFMHIKSRNNIFKSNIIIEEREWEKDICLIPKIRIVN